MLLLLLSSSLLFVFRLTALKEPVYSQREAEMAAGMGNYVVKSPDVAVTDVNMKNATLTT